MENDEMCGIISSMKSLEETKNDLQTIVKKTLTKNVSER